MRSLKTFGLALVLLWIQIFTLWSQSPVQDWEQKDSILFIADSKWYASIVDRGYVSTHPPVSQNKEKANVAFFPGYPLWAWIVKSVTSLETPLALLWAARASTFVFWVYFILWFERQKLSGWIQAGSILLILTHPASFYMVVGYSESTFLALMMGFLYWGLESRSNLLGPSVSKIRTALSLLHGGVANATRVAGALTTLLPFRQFFSGRKSVIPFFQSFLLGLGVLGFFAYCHIQFGAWDLYQQMQSIGWGQRADYTAFFKPDVWTWHLPSAGNAHSIGLFLIPATGVLWSACLASEILQNVSPAARRNRLPCYVLVLSVLYLQISGVYHQQLASFFRFHLGVSTFMILALSSRLSEIPSKKVKQALFLMMCAVSGIGLRSLLQFAADFSRDRWVG